MHHFRNIVEIVLNCFSHLLHRSFLFILLARLLGSSPLLRRNPLQLVLEGVELLQILILIVLHILEFLIRNIVIIRGFVVVNEVELFIDFWESRLKTNHLVFESTLSHFFVILRSRSASLCGATSANCGRSSLMLTANVEELVLDGFRYTNLLVDNSPLFLFLKSVNDLPCKHFFDLTFSWSIELIELLSHLCLPLGVLRLFLFHWYLKIILL